MQHFTELEAWKVGIALLKEIYTLTKTFPREELYGMTAQLKRAAASILANIAEGFGRHTYADKAARFTIARGESFEVEAFIIAATELALVTDAGTAVARNLTTKEQRLLSGLISSFRNRST